MATEKEAIEEIRKDIKVTSMSKDDDGNATTVVEGSDDVKEEVKEPEQEEEVIEEEVKEEEVEASEETTEDVEKLKRQIEKLKKRIGKTTAEKTEIKQKLDASEAKLSAKPDSEKVLTEKDVDDLAERKANAKISERDFVNACNKIFDDGVKVTGLKADVFEAKVKEMTDDIGAIPPAMVVALEDLDNPGAVLNMLTEDTDLAEKIYIMPPIKMGVELAKLAGKLAAKPKKPVKEISKAPDPVNPLGGKAKASTEINLNAPNLSDAEWIEKRQKDIEQKRQAGRVNLR